MSAAHLDEIATMNHWACPRSAANGSRGSALIQCVGAWVLGFKINLCDTPQAQAVMVLYCLIPLV